MHYADVDIISATVTAPHRLATTLLILIGNLSIIIFCCSVFVVLFSSTSVIVT